MNDSVTQHRGPQGGPPLAPLALVSAGLLIAGLALAAALGGTVPAPTAAGTTIRAYVTGHPDALRASGILTFASAVPLGLYAATASSRLRRLGVTAPGATIALAGGLLAAASLALSGLLLWVLAQPTVADDGPLVRALHDLAFATGGPGHTVALGLLLAGVAVPTLFLGLLPRPLAALGLGLGVLGALTTLVLVWPVLAPVLPVARFAGLAWLVAAGVLLPRTVHGVGHRRRTRRAPAV